MSFSKNLRSSWLFNISPSSPPIYIVAIVLPQRKRQPIKNCIWLSTSYSIILTFFYNFKCSEKNLTSVTFEKTFILFKKFSPKDCNLISKMALKQTSIINFMHRIIWMVSNLFMIMQIIIKSIFKKSEFKSSFLKFWNPIFSFKLQAERKRLSMKEMMIEDITEV